MHEFGNNGLINNLYNFIISINKEVIIHENVVIGPEVNIGENSIIMPNCTLSNTIIGKNCLIQSGAVIGDKGFGFTPDQKIEIKHIGKFDPEQVISAIHYDGKLKSHYIKRFQIETSSTGKRFKFIREERGSKLLLVSVHANPELVFNYRLKNGDKRSKEIILLDFIDVKGWKANGNKLGGFSRMSGFKINELEIEEKIETEVEENVMPIEVSKDNSGDELSLF